MFTVTAKAKMRQSPGMISLAGLRSMRLKARGLTRHSGPPGLLEESDPASMILYVMDGPYRRLSFPYRTGCPDRSCTSAS
jgi:hypothetical protein